MPGIRFAHDYVQSGAAQGLVWSEPMAPQIARLTQPDPERARAATGYIKQHLAITDGAIERVADLIASLVETADARVA